MRPSAGETIALWSCGTTLSGLRYHRAANMPFWKIDKFIRKYVGPNPFRAHDVIGAGGAVRIRSDSVLASIRSPASATARRTSLASSRTFPGHA